jgi:hypothetical protein
VPVATNFQVPGLGEADKDRIRRFLISALHEKKGRWHVQFIGSRNDPLWEVRVSGPGVEASELVEAATAKTDPYALASVVLRMAG